MGLFDLSQTIIAEFLKEPDKQRSLRLFASSPEGREVIENYLNSPEGPQMIRVLLPMILRHLEIPEKTREEIQESLEKK